MSNIQEAIDAINNIDTKLDSHDAKMAEFVCDYEETIRKALKQAQEIAEGKAHVMRWVEVDNDNLPDLEYTEQPYLVELLEPNTRYTIDTSDNYYATFNGSPSIPPTDTEGE